MMSRMMGAYTYTDKFHSFKQQFAIHTQKERQRERESNITIAFVKSLYDAPKSSRVIEYPYNFCIITALTYIKY